MGNLKRFSVLMLLLLLLFFSPSCKKSSDPRHHLIPEDFKQYYLYQKGSYWIYQNDKTSEIDSTYIDTDPYSWQENTLNDNGSVVAIDDHINISFNGTVLRSCGMVPYEVWVGTKITDDIVYNKSFPEGSKWVLDQYHVYQYLHHYDSLQIGSSYLHDIRETRYSIAMFYNGTDSLSTTFFYAKNIGLVRITHSTIGIDTTWSVIRYHPVQ